MKSLPTHQHTLNDDADINHDTVDGEVPTSTTVRLLFTDFHECRTSKLSTSIGLLLITLISTLTGIPYYIYCTIIACSKTKKGIEKLSSVVKNLFAGKGTTNNGPYKYA